MWTVWFMLVLCHGQYYFTSASQQNNYITREDVELLLRRVEIKHDAAVASLKQEINELQNDKLKMESVIQQLLKITQRPMEKLADTHTTESGERVMNGDAFLKEDHVVLNQDLDSRLKHEYVLLEENRTGAKRYLLGSGPQTIGLVGISFSVTLSTDGISNIGRNQPVHFDKVISNLGNNYDVSAALFRVPVSGWYAFSLTLMSRPNETQKLIVVKNNVEAFHCYAQGNEFNTASRTVVIHASRGEAIWVQTASESTFSTTVHGYEQTSFTGFILYAD